MAGVATTNTMIKGEMTTAKLWQNKSGQNHQNTIGKEVQHTQFHLQNIYIFKKQSQPAMVLYLQHPPALRTVNSDRMKELL